jgi:hypothetical protein
MGGMSTVFSRLAGLLAGLRDHCSGPYPAEPADADADVRRVSAEVSAIRARFADQA